MHPSDELHEYLRGDSALSRQYRRISVTQPPPELESRVLQAAAAKVDAPVDVPVAVLGSRQSAPHGEARDGRAKPPYLAPLAFAASVLLSVAVVLAIVFGPQPAKHHKEAPHLVRTAAHAGLAPSTLLPRKLELYSSDPPRMRTAAAWLADIDALRRAGRDSEADAELRRFRSAYPDQAAGEFKSLR